MEKEIEELLEKTKEEILDIVKWRKAYIFPVKNIKLIKHKKARDFKKELLKEMNNELINILAKFGHKIWELQK